MPFCPRCRSEYLEGIAKCGHCDVELVAELPEAAEDKSERLRQAVASHEAKQIARSTYTEACQLVEALHLGGVDAMVTGDPSTCGKGGTCSHFFVSVLAEDVRAAAGVLNEEWRRLVQMDPESHGVNPDVVLDFDAEGAHACPACGATFDGAPEECPECGLFLGVA